MSIGLNKDHLLFLKQFDEAIDRIVEQLIERVPLIDQITLEEFYSMPGLQYRVTVPFVYDRLQRKVREKK